MFKFIESSDNVIALKLTNTITGDDLNAIMDRLDDMMAKQENIHVFVETQAIDGCYRRSATGCLNQTGATRHSLGWSEDKNAMRHAAMLMSAFQPIPDISSRSAYGHLQLVGSAYTPFLTYCCQRQIFPPMFSGGIDERGKNFAREVARDSRSTAYTWV